MKFWTTLARIRVRYVDIQAGFQYLWFLGSKMDGISSIGLFFFFLEPVNFIKGLSPKLKEKAYRKSSRSCFFKGKTEASFYVVNRRTAIGADSLIT